jgi:hypothetical protein
MTTQPELEELVRKSVFLYNRLRSPEITAKPILVSQVIITVSFTGAFCYGCGIFDYVEGFAEQFKAFTDKVELKVGKTRQIDPRNFEADYIVKTK